MVDLPNPSLKCHRTGFTKGCRKLVASGACSRWVTIEGEEPQNGTPMVRSDCADNWPVTLLIDVARKVANGSLGIQKATERFRNNVVLGVDSEERIPTRAEAMKLAVNGHGDEANAKLLEQKR